MKTFKITGMSCAACSQRVERAVSTLPNVEKCSVNLLLGTMTVLGDATEDEIVSAVTSAGYGAEKKTDIGLNVNNNLQNSKKKIAARLCVSAVLLSVLMYISMFHVMLGAPLPSFLGGNAPALGILEGILSLAVLLINYRFFVNGVRGALHIAPNMDTLVALGAGASFVYSGVMVVKMLLSAESVRAGYLHGLYFESAAMIVTLISVGKLLEARAKSKTTNALTSLMSLAPRTALVLHEGREVTVSADELEVGDIFILKPGALVPCDGVVIEGESQVSEAALTGEFMPKDKTVGDSVLCATANGRGYLKCRAVKVGSDTAISAVIRLCEEAAATKAPIARVADKVAGIFVPSVILISLLTLGIWLLVGAELGYALGRCISVLVISCPCALGLATPVAITVGSGIGARRGILFKSAEALENFGRAEVVAIDKTGTLTVGEPVVSDVVCYGVSRGELISLAYCAEYRSEHPIARAVISLAEREGAELYPTEGFAATPGAGVRCITFGEEVLAVSHGFAKGQRLLSERAEEDYSRLSEEGKTVVFVAKGGVLSGIIAISDKLRDEAPEAISALSRMGVSVVMLTGDNEKCALAAAAGAGIKDVRAELLPEGKALAISALSESKTVVMIGDGINDAPSLAAADVGVAVGTGTDIAIEAADAVIMQSSLLLIPEALRIGRAVLKNIKENLFWAFIYNVIGIPLAAGAFAYLLGWEMSPMIGALAMSLSSFSVVMNALRLNYKFRLGKGRARDGESAEGYSVISEQANSDEQANSETNGKNSENNKNGENGKNNNKEENNMSFTLYVEGMMCPHCEARVKATVEGVCGVISAKVSHVEGVAVVEASEDCKAAVAEAIRAAGYAVK